MVKPGLKAALEQRLRLPPPERPHERLFAITAWLALLLSGLSTLLAFPSGLVALGSLNLVGTVISALALRGLDRLERTANWFLWSFTICLSVGALATTPMDPTALGYLFVVPLLSANVLGPEATRRWSYRVLVLGTLSTIAGNLGWTVPEVDPMPTVDRVMNFASTLWASMALLHALARERTASEERLREAERAKSVFFANMGHEIRTPMNGVLGMTDALLQRPLGHEEHQMVQTIRSSGAVMLSLVDDLLDVSKLEAGKLTLREAALELAGLAAELRTLWTPLAQQKGLALTVELGAGLPPRVLIDGLRLRQILNNLVNNALKFTEAGSVTLRFAAEGEQGLRCTVEDTGIGISPEHQQRLFGRFVQADDARARRYQGAGLGLMLSRELARLMGGELELVSTPGVGSRFSCLLPVEAALAPVTPPPVQARELPVGLKVLVVDDNPVNRLVVHKLLDRSGCAVEVAVDGRAALVALEAASFDVVLMDVQMPEMDGLEATRHIRARGAGGPRIIGVSASAESSDVESCHAAGMDDFLAKPITRERLIETLLRHLPAQA